jgi:flagellar protein FliO/FliZ
LNNADFSIAAHRILRAAGGWLLASSACAAASAADAPAFAAVGAQGTPGAVAGTLRVTLAMVLVLGALLLSAWLARRMRGASGAAASGLQVLAQVSLGTRERAVLLRAGGRQLLVGVAPGSVRTLHVFDAAQGTTGAPGDAPDESEAGAALSPGGPERPTFKSLLLKSLGK